MEPTAPNQLRLRLSQLVDPDTLARLHEQGIDASLPQELRALLEEIRARRMDPVHVLKPGELAEDRYGFAREFKLTVEAEERAALKRLVESPLVEEARTVILRRGSEGPQRG